MAKMKKTKLTQKEKKACRDVIAFWKKIEKRLVNKEKIKDGWWVEDDLVVPMSCSLCELVEGDVDCEDCVYYKAYGYMCTDDDGHLERFRLNPNLRTCRACIRAIQRILDNAK